MMFESIEKSRKITAKASSQKRACLATLLLCAVGCFIGQLLPVRLQAAEPLEGVVHADGTPTKTIHLSGNDIVFDGTQELDWAEAQANEEDPQTIPDGRWVRTNKAPNVGGGDKIVWYRMRFQNNLEAKARYYFMSLDGLLSNVVKLHILRTDGPTEKLVTGTSLARADRPTSSQLLTLPMEFQSQETLTAYFGILSSNSRNLFYHVRSDKSCTRFELAHMLFFGLYMGILAFVALIHFLAGFAVKDRVNYYYSAFVATAGLVAFFSNGFFHFLIPATWVVPGEKIDAAAVPLLMLVFSVFSKRFLETQSWSRLAGHFFNFATCGSVLMFISGLFGFNQSGAAEVQDVFIKIISVGCLVVAGFAIWRQATPFAWSYLLGFGMYLVGANIWTMQFTMETPSSWYTCYAVFGYQILQNIVFSTAVMLNIRRSMLTSAKEKATAHYGERMSMFVRVLTHDLSNYITTIDSSLMILTRPNTSEEVRQRLLDKSRKAILQQKEVLESIKELKAVEDGKAQLRLEVVDVNQLLSDLAATFETRLAAKNLHLEIPDSPALKVWADRKTLFHSVICNLVSNAIKFSHDAGTIKVAAEASSSGGVVIKISDSGIGMPADLVAKIFNDGEQTSRLGTGGEKGTGFGLPICKAYMTLYEGSISVTSIEKGKSETDHGTTFCLEFKQAA